MREGEPGAERDLRADDAVTAIEFMLDAEHMHRTALALGNTGLASGQLGHDDLWVDTIGEHVAMVAIAGDDAVLVAVERRLQPDRDGFLSAIEVAEAAEQHQTIVLARLLLEKEDPTHFAIENFEFLRRSRKNG